MASDTEKNGDRKAAIPFRSIWCVDFEFRSADGEHPAPICMVAREYRSGQVIRLWQHELANLSRAPFDVDGNAVMVAYMAAAEISCFLQLGWPLPSNVLDLYCEHRVETNGRYLQAGNGLLGALALRGKAHIQIAEKDSMRRLACDQQSWSPEERRALLDYCESDVDGLCALLDCMDIAWPYATYRGRYMSAVARIERTGIPIDADIYNVLNERWADLKIGLIDAVRELCPVYEGTSFKQDRFAEWLASNRIAWPRLTSGALALNDETFKSMEAHNLSIAALRELRQTLAVLRRSIIPVGSDGRARTSLIPFRSKTGRNQPPASRFAFGPAKWLRGIIRPPPGQALAYIDFASQEIGIAAGLSGDERLIESYTGEDLYLAFARHAGLAPVGATKASHGKERDICKAVVLGLNYGMGAEQVAYRAGISVSEAKLLIEVHRRTYRKFWSWIDSVVSSAMITNEQTTTFGWRRLIGPEDRATSLMNFPMQANGAEAMRIAAIAAVEAGIDVCAPIHDAFLIQAPANDIDDVTRYMRQLMAQAGSTVTGGLALRTDARIIRDPDRYMEERGISMWNRVVELVGRSDAIYRPAS